MSAITIEHIGLPAEDTRQLAEFYRDVLGFEIIYESDTEPPVFFVRDASGMSIEIVPPGPDKSASNAFMTHLALWTDDFDATLQELSAKGVRFEPEVSNEFFGGTRMAFFTDPGGHRAQIIWRKQKITG